LVAEHKFSKRLQREPTHPSVILADALIAMELKIAPAARHLGISRQLLHKILSGLASITPRLAVHIGKLCGNGPDPDNSTQPHNRRLISPIL
jgi:addiction module HigA family antidote